MGVRRDLLLRFLLTLWDALLQFRSLVAIPASILSGPRYRVRMARVSAWLRNGGETPFCAVCWPARGRVWRLPTRTRSVCNSSSRGVAALFASTLFLAAGFGEPDPSCHAGAASPTGGCSRAFLVELDDAWQLGSFRIRLGSRLRLAAFIVGVLVAGQSAAVWGLPSVLWLTAAGLFAAALSTRLVPDLAPGTNSTTQKRKVIERDWLILLREPVFVRMVLAAALVIGSHAMHDAFAIIRWRDAGISPAVSSVLWSESVGAEVLVFVLFGPWLLSLLGRSGALALAAGAAVVRWGVMAQTADVTTLAIIEPLHGLTFALFHLGCMRIIADTVPSSLAGMAQAFYGTVGIGAATALSSILSGWLFARWGPAGFWGMALLCCAAFPIIWSLHIALSQDLSRSTSRYP